MRSAVSDFTASRVPAFTDHGPSRRAFLIAAGTASLGVLARTAFCATVVDRHWVVARDFVLSGAIGDVRNASATIPMDAGRAARRQLNGYSDETVPGPIADALAGMIFVLSSKRPLRIQTSEHREAGAFSMTCLLESGRQIAVAGAPAGAALAATFRGTMGSLYIMGDMMAVESDGHWREVRI